MLETRRPCSPSTTMYPPPPIYWESSETKTTFHDLQRYADVQNMAIQTLYKSRKYMEDPVFIQSTSPEWNAFWNATWKKGENTFHRTVEVRRDHERFDDSLL